MKLRRLAIEDVMDFYGVDVEMELSLPYIEAIPAGFPSPADDYMELSLDLNKALVPRPHSTFFARVKGNSMEMAGIYDGDILIIDKSVEPQDKKFAVCYIDGEFTIKQLRADETGVWLVPFNKNYSPIKVTEENHFIIWGIVTYVIHKL